MPNPPLLEVYECGPTEITPDPQEVVDSLLSSARV